MLIELIKSYKNRKIVLLFIMFQLIIAYIIVINAWTTILKPSFTEQIYYSNMNINPENTYTMWATDMIKGDTNNFLNFEKEIYDTIDDGKITGYGAHYKTEIYIDNEDIMKKWNEVLHKKFGNAPIRTEIIKTDEIVYEMVNIQILEGMDLSGEPDTKTDTPVLVGYELKDILPIGTEFKSPIGGGNNEDYTVVGVLKSRSKWPHNDLRKAQMIDVDHLMISLFSPNTRDTSRLNIINRTNSMILSSEKSPAETMSTLKEISEKTATPVIMTRLSDEFKKEEIRNTDNVKNTVFIAIILLTVAISGVIMTTLSTLSERKYELGVRMSVGYTKKDIWKMVLSDLLLKNIFALFIAYAFSILLVSERSMGNYVYSFEILTSFRTIAMVLCTMAIIIFISVLIPRIVINRYSIVDLIRRED